MSHTRGQAVNGVGMKKTSTLQGIKGVRTSGGGEELGQGAIEPGDLHGFSPPLTDDTATGNGTEERGVTGGETALAEANTRATLAEARRRVLAPGFQAGAIVVFPGAPGDTFATLSLLPGGGVVNPVIFSLRVLSSS